MPVATALVSFAVFVSTLVGVMVPTARETAVAGTDAPSAQKGATSSAPAPEATPEPAADDARGEGAPNPGAPASAFPFDETRVVAELRAFRAQLERRARLVEADRVAVLVLLERVDERIAELDRRLRNLQSLRDELRELVGVLDEREAKRLERLVRIYEGMKPKRAAAIFDRLDMEVLLPIAARMRPNRLALVLQSMDPERARELTRRLSESPPRPDLSVLGVEAEGPQAAAGRKR